MDNQLSTRNLENEIDNSDSLVVTPKSQTVAKKMAEIARLKQLENKAQTAIKVVIGGAVLSYASRNSNFAKTLVEILDKSVTRDNDLKRINATLDNLRKKAGLLSKQELKNYSGGQESQLNNILPQQNN